MKTRTMVILAICLVAGVCSAGDADSEQTLRDLDAQWSAAAGAKDVEKTVSFYSDDAVLLPPNAPLAS